MTHTTVALLAAGLTGLVASAWDLRTRRLPNLLTFGSALAALVFCSATGGLRGLGWSVAGWLAGCAVFLPFFLVRGMGAGDVKLLAALGAWLGPITVLWTAAFGAMAGGVLAIGVLLAHGYLRQAFSNVGYVLWYWKSVGPAPVPQLTLADSKGPRLPYAVPILVGMIAALWLKG
jgi:prepilin peptidase CpaA